MTAGTIYFVIIGLDKFSIGTFKKGKNTITSFRE